MALSTRQNRKLAVKWATQQVNRSNVVISDQFWSCVDSFDQADVIANKLAEKDILVFNGPTKTGAVLVHKEHKGLTVGHMDIASDRPHLDKEVVYMGNISKDGHVTLLSPWQLNFF